MAGEPDAKGRVAKELAGVDTVEIKATIPEHQVQQALERYHIKLGNEERYIYFFDTPELDLFEAGVIGRVRRVIGQPHDSTVKFRPIEPGSVPEVCRQFKGFKIEADSGENAVVKSASLTMPVKKGLIKRVAAGAKTFDALFTEEQRTFLLLLASRKLDLMRIEMMGPIQVWKWKKVDPGLPWPLTGELWRREDESRILEVSIKVPVAQAPAARAGFMAFLAEAGAQRDDAQQAKTRWALEFFAARSRALRKAR